MQYRLITHDATDFAPWEHNFQVASPQMAVDYARRLAKSLRKSVMLWQLPNPDDMIPIGTITVETQTTATFTPYTGRS